MRLVVKHLTHYVYEQPIAHMIQQLRLTPHTQEGQKILSWSVTVPDLERGAHYTDGFGNRVDLVSHRDPVTKLDVLVEGVVETKDTSGIVGTFPYTAPDTVFRRFTHLTQMSPAIRRLGAIAENADDISGFHELMHAIRDKVGYQTGVTEVHTTAADALSSGLGVCQDHAHIFISAARSIGVPARYVSGYMLMEDEQDSEAHHAWAEVKLPSLGWVGFDVSNGMCPTERYIRLTCGLDSRSAAPIRGVRRGSGGETMSVEVAVLQESAQSQQ
ncbi:transglutaminase family protein [Stappia sp. ES.058]|uniref:transglutaminase family protein n=1 Tax=Stappia sp. ES.058 TaxID=1881061 RepID=UPI00087B9D01|nr:transglutaminase family protein [Stappia sp. ES.058]SDU20411.1 Transglutaminase-like enzyme, putative cysteine protease [Stappia sp. ES.058]